MAPLISDLHPSVLELISCHLPDPRSFLGCSRASSALVSSPRALALWLVNRYGSQHAAYVLMKPPCLTWWPVWRVRQLVQAMLDLGVQPVGTETPKAVAVLHWAAVTLGDATTLQLLLGSRPAGLGADARQWCSCLGGQLLTAAASAGHRSPVAALLSAGAVPRDASALKAAAEHGHEGVVSELLASGVIDMRADDDCALRMAARGGHAAVIQLLVDAGCNTSAKQDEALCLAVGGGHLAAVLLLLRAGAQPVARNGLLQVAASTGEAEALIEALIQAGAVDDCGLALCTAAAAGKVNLVSMLLQQRGKYPMGHESSTTTFADIGLTAHTGGPHSAFRDPRTAALQYALMNGHLSVARHLLEAGAPIDAALLAARRRFLDRPASLQLLDIFPANVGISEDLDDELDKAAVDADDDFLRLALHWGVSPTGRDCQALRKAVLHGRLECVRTIISAAGVAGLKHDMPCCVIRAAVQRGHLEVVSELLSAGLWPSSSAHHCCADPQTCAPRILCAAGTSSVASLLMQYAIYAGEALRLVSSGRVPAWRCDEAVQIVMDAFVSQSMKSAFICD